MGVSAALFLTACGSPEPAARRVSNATTEAVSTAALGSTQAPPSTEAPEQTSTAASTSTLESVSTATTVPSPASTVRPAAAPEAVNETDIALTLPAGFKISYFTPEFIGPVRFMAFSPDGILFVSLPSRAGLYSGNRSGGAVFALPDRDQDGQADEVETVISGLSTLPHGLAFNGGYLYLAEENRVSRYPYTGSGTLGAREVIVESIPAGGHVSRTVGFGPSGKMYVSVGSSCNVCEEADPRRAAIVEYNPDGSGERVFAEGIRNAVGLVFHPVTGQMWATENGRDLLGDDLPPDEINIVREGRNYGWPFCYGKRIPDLEFNNQSTCTTTEESVHDLQAHSAPLGLRFIDSPQFPEEWQGDLLVAYHGSWNRSEPTGYKVVRLNVEGREVVGESDFIHGWLLDDGSSPGRPVDLIFGPQDGALYISDDKAGVVYRVTRVQ